MESRTVAIRLIVKKYTAKYRRFNLDHHFTQQPMASTSNTCT